MINISFTDDPTPAARGVCPICSSDKRRPLLKLSGGTLSASGLHVDSCGNCGTCFFIDEKPVIGYGSPDFERDYWINYVQNGAGISVMIEALLAVDRPRTGSLLDIGCGFGFVPHFWQTCGFGDAVGMEVSEYGALGAEKLSVDIIPKFYGDAEELQGLTFDYVFSSEVIEHVEDPSAFVTEISAALAPDGILILTTPSATALTQSKRYLELLQILSPQFHFFIASRQGLEDLLKACGFAHVLVRDTGNRLFAWASHAPLPKINDSFSDWPLYLDYLKELSKIDDPHVASGSLYRTMKDAFNLGMFDRAAHAFEAFSNLARETFGIDYNDIMASAPKRRSRTQLDNRTFPAWMGVSMLYAGLIKQREEATPEVQLDLFSEAIETMEREIELSYQRAGEPAYFIGRAKAEHAAVWNAMQPHEPQTADTKQRFVLRRPALQTGQDICLFALYAPEGKISPATVEYMNLLARNGFTVIACVAMDDTTCDLEVLHLSEVAGIVVRENGGMDFSAWSTALHLLPDCWSASRLVFANDSVLALPDLMGPFFKNLRSQTADFVFLTECFHHAHHGQSYFFVLQSKALDNRAVREFWANVEVLEKLAVIWNYELRLLAYAKEDWEMSTHVLFSMETLFPNVAAVEYMGLNVAHTHWEYLISHGFPLVKVELLRDNPLRLHIQQWRSVLDRHGASLPNIDAHFEIRAGEKNEDDIDSILDWVRKSAKTWNRKRKIARNLRQLKKQFGR